MCGIAGIIDLKKDISNQMYVIEKMTETLNKRGPDQYGIYGDKNALLGHRRLIVVDPSGGGQPMIKKIGNKKFVVVYNGELYNTDELRNELKKKGYKFESYSDTEVVLVSYIEWGKECVKKFNGIFAFGIWDECHKTAFLARDPLGVKPLFYTIKGNTLIFGSLIKTLLTHPEIEPIVDKEGLLEVFGLGPARSLGNGVFKGINEIPPAFCLTFNEYGVKLEEYWKLKAEPHTESVEETAEHVRSLLVDAIQRQLVADVPVCTFLSGGLDSSIISAVAAEYFRKKGKVLDTYSIDYLGNDKYFKSNEFQPDSDEQWAQVMVDFIKSNHHSVILDNHDVAVALLDAVKANNLPGMADVDSSLYLFCKEVRKNFVVTLSGECADEIFGGYPWYRKHEDVYADTFPWSKSVGSRREILSKDLKNLPLEDYVAEKYNDSIKQVPHLDGESEYEYKIRQLFYLNVKWFMITLLNRKDRMSMANSLEVRVPFADYRLVQYAFNLPTNIRFYNDREKGILRLALKGMLPDGIIERKKSPYPKTHNPVYTKVVIDTMKNIMSDKNSPILQLIDFENVTQIVETGGASFGKPWFGQLMTGPQLIAFLIQVNEWLKEYNVKIMI